MGAEEAIPKVVLHETIVVKPETEIVIVYSLNTVNVEEVESIKQELGSRRLIKHENPRLVN